ncbi:hypothetical protein D4R89_08795 [bacterium]|nr:MAG: hypothetical protein D4R89_08795 [bacterium]
MTKKKPATTLLILAVLPAILMLSGCNPLEDDSKSSSFIIVESITGTDLSGKTAGFLQSDVVLTNSIVTADVATATLRASLLDPAPILKPGQFNDIMLDRYIVSYSRVDGKNRQGVDVPYSFEGALTQLLKIGTSTSISFVVVREVAKLESPLIDLAQNRAEGVIEATAKIEFYGHDLVENKVKVTGYLTIFFANYADSTTAPATLQ